MTVRKHHNDVRGKFMVKVAFFLDNICKKK